LGIFDLKQGSFTSDLTRSNIFLTQSDIFLGRKNIFLIRENLLLVRKIFLQVREIISLGRKIICLGREIFLITSKNLLLERKIPGKGRENIFPGSKTSDQPRKRPSGRVPFGGARHFVRAVRRSGD
jgi:hypothetical protein